MRTRFVVLVALFWFGHPLIPSRSFAQGIITQWNFPLGFSLTAPAPSTGSGSAALLGGTNSFPGAGNTAAGSTNIAANNRAWFTVRYPTQGTNSGTAGVRFNASTLGQSNLIFRFDQYNTTDASRYLQLQYTTNGTTWNVADTFVANLGDADNWVNNRTVDLSTISGVNNNANFGVRLVTIFAPGTSTYQPTGNSFPYDRLGAIQFDAVTLSAANVWVGGSGSSLGVGANYQGGVAPTATGTVLFTSAGGGVVRTVTAGTALDQVVFRSDAPSHLITGSGNLTLRAGLVNNSSNIQTISAPVNFGRSNTIQNNGQLVLSGNVNFTNYLNLQGGGTTVFNGTINGTLSADTSGNPASPTVRVGSGSTLGGTGTINQSVLISPGGNLSIGDLSGPIQLGSLAVNGTFSFASGGVSTWNVDLRNNLNADVLDLSGGTGNLVFGSTAPNSILLNLTALDALDDKVTKSYIIATKSSGASFTGFNSSLFAFQTNGFLANAFAVGVNGNNLVLTFTTVPEPGSILLISALGLAGVHCWRRRKGSSNEAPQAI